MNVLLVLPSEGLVEKVAENLTPIGKDYSSSLVIFPGKRPSYFLRKVLADKEQSSLVPPVILSIDEFIDHVHDESLGFRGKKLEAVDAISILHHLHSLSPGHLGDKSFLSPDIFFPVGLKLYDDLEELLIEGVPSRKVREIDAIAGENIPEPTARRLQSLSYFYETFYQAVKEGHFSTRASRYRAVSEHIGRLDLSLFKKVILAGFFALTESEKMIFRSLMKRENTLFIFQEGEGMKKKLSELGIAVQGRGACALPDMRFYKSPDSHGQVFGVSTLLKRKMDLNERMDQNTVIVLPSAEALLPLFHHALNLLRPDTYNISLGYPLQRTPLFSFINNLMEVVASSEGERLYLPAYLNFILHPYMKNIYFDGRTDITRILFHAVEETLTEKRTRKFLSISELEKDQAVLHSIEQKVGTAEPGITLKAMKLHLEAIHSHTIGKMRSFRDVGDFADKLKQVIEYIYHNSTARLHPLFYPYAESFIGQLDLLSKSLMKGIRFEEVGSYFTLFRKYIANAYTPFTGTPLSGVQVLGFMETRNLQFENVLFLDANEGVLPDTAREDAFLPFKARRWLGLPTYLDREEIMFYTFDTLIRGTKQCDLFYVENDEQERSRFVERLLWERQKREKERDDKKYVRTIQYAVSLREKSPRPMHKTQEIVQFFRGYPFSATSLNTYLHCPLQFYYEYGLGLREREVLSEEFEKEEIGSFVHLVLLEYFKGKTGSVLTEKEMDVVELKRLIHKRFEEQYGKDPTGEVFLLRSQIESHLKDFIRNYQVPRIRQVRTTITDLEKRIEVQKDSFKLRARVDRVEKRGEKTTIIDYKTSANKSYLTIRPDKLDLKRRDSWGAAIPTLQLPFYLMTYSYLTGEKPEAIDCLFLLLGRTRIDAEIEVPLFRGEAEFRKHFPNLTSVIFGLLAEIVDPDLPFVPTTDPKNECARCAYGYICTNT